jgi:hypothetical protein
MKKRQEQLMGDAGAANVAVQQTTGPDQRKDEALTRSFAVKIIDCNSLTQTEV